ncbi:sugar phosphate isomerase/epimerase family protein [Chitinophaga rhizophila]|uniref:Sugar phosphate isomerase/epimerase n=1 Tax=Chitinophaga rhizophila TaxID=2866212 RepID=A0ABS7GGZ9_9BACT|nr:sugar phosphate isomerase/epimerase [Chitinophaga rhizophila]MBW8686959.1 sugar phosphate isomerase/epimerase [Chitinophaga rhizophila]
MSSRRIFMQQAGLLAAGLMVNPTGIFSRSRENTVNKIGIQLYTLRDQLAKDVKGTIRKVAEIGYNHVETFYGYKERGQKDQFWGLDPKGLKALLKEYRLATHSGHYQLNDFLTRGNGNDEALKVQLEIAHELGQQYLIVPIPPLQLWDKLATDDYKFIADQLNKAGEEARKLGMRVGYHNHFWEFKQQPDVNTTGYEIMLKGTDPSLVTFELDLFWAIKSGIDPVALFKQHPGRFSMWHVKDIDKGTQEKIVGGDNDKKTSMEILPKVKFAEVGTGAVNFKELFANASVAGLKYAFVEQDQISIDPFESIKTSYGYVKSNLLRK